MRRQQHASLQAAHAAVACLIFAATFSGCDPSESVERQPDGDAANQAADSANDTNGALDASLETIDAGASCASGQEGSACDDGDACTAGETCQSGACKGGLMICACRVDADCPNDLNPCNGTQFCDTIPRLHRCRAKLSSVVSCDPSKATPCAMYACDPNTGACAHKPVADDTPCTDGTACTVEDRCLAGVCQGGQDSICACQTNVDCGALEDGNLCNGTLYCDKAAFPHTCRVNPATVVSCATATEPCLVNACAPTTGLCAPTPAEQTEVVCVGGAGCMPVVLAKPVAGSPPSCDDGDPCTSGDQCAGGKCAGPVDTCTCSKQLDCESQEDGDLCNGTLYCDLVSGTCKLNPATVISCPSAGDTACLKNACIAKTGTCAPSAMKNGTLCDDGDACTSYDICVVGSCKAGTNVCTCKDDGDCASKDDGNKCNGTKFCNLGVCMHNPATVVTCPSLFDTACQVNACVPLSGSCTATAIERTRETCAKTGGCGREVIPTNGAPSGPHACNDGNACTTNDVCAKGVCVPGVKVCACQQDVDCLNTDDGDLCNGTPFCDKTNPAQPACKHNPATVVYCPKTTDTFCLANTCDPKTGGCALAPRNSGKSCNDGTLCTKDETCVGGSCDGVVVSCDDGSSCTADGCLPTLGCTHLKTNCDDGNGCTVDLCDAKTGACVFDKAVTQNKVCDADGDGCTVGDTCDSGTCKTGPAMTCQGTTAACEQRICNSTGPTSFACVLTNRPDGAACADGAACTVGASCAKGVCTPGGKERLFALKILVSGGSLRLRAAAPEGSGALLAGQTTSANTTAWWVARVDAAGDTLPGWPRQLAKATSETNAPVWVGPGPTVIGTAVNAQGGTDLALVVLSKDGQAIALSKMIGIKEEQERALGAVLHPASGWLVLGTSGDTSRAWRVSASGLLGWTYKGLPGRGALHAGAVVGGDVVAVGWHGAPLQEQGFAARLGNTGNVVWSKPLSSPVSTTNARVVAAVSHLGGALLAGEYGLAAPKLWLSGLAADGSVQWQRATTTPMRVGGMAARALGGALVVGQQKLTQNGAANAILLAITHTGHQEWTRYVDAGADGGAHAVATLAGDAAWIVGDAGTDMGVAGLAWRTDAFGHASCETAGVCALQSAVGCADKQLCTEGLCDPKTGCFQAANSEACDDGDACSEGDACIAGSCKSGLPKVCDDADVCTQDSCSANAGCLHDAVKDGTPCGGGKVCFAGACSKRFAIAVATSSRNAGSAYVAGTVVITPDGSAKAWGLASDKNTGLTGWGQAETCAKTAACTPEQPVAVPKVDVWRKIVGDTFVMCGITGKREVYCWGNGAAAGFGSGAHLPHPTILVAASNGALDVDVSAAIGCAVTELGKKVVCWGYNSHFQTGTGTCCSPQQGVQAVVGLPNAVSAVAVGSAHACALATSGAVWCWGKPGTDGQFGQLGNGVLTGSATPTKVAGIEDGIALAAGHHHTCVLRKGGTVQCWGANTDGQAGNGSLKNTLKPTPVYGLAGVQQLVASYYRTCALTVQGEVLCWGNGSDGGLGAGHSALQLVPGKVKGLTNVVHIALSRHHACAVRTDGSVWCWGSNAGFALGTTAIKTYSDVPVLVPASAP